MHHEPRLHAAHRHLCAVIVRGDVNDELVLVHLAAAGEEGGHGGDAEAAADIAHQVVNAGGVAHLLFGDARHAGGHQRNEEESHGPALDYLRPEDVPVTCIEVEVRQADHGPATHDH